MLATKRFLSQEFIVVTFAKNILSGPYKGPLRAFICVSL